MVRQNDNECSRKLEKGMDYKEFKPHQRRILFNLLLKLMGFRRYLDKAIRAGRQGVHTLKVAVMGFESYGYGTRATDPE
jgi:hypothetical protein